MQVDRRAENVCLRYKNNCGKTCKSDGNENRGYEAVLNILSQPELVE